MSHAIIKLYSFVPQDTGYAVENYLWDSNEDHVAKGMKLLTSWTDPTVMSKCEVGSSPGVMIQVRNDSFYS